MKFKVLIGTHADERGKSYGVGDVVESASDLVARFGANKFECIDDTQAAPSDDESGSTGGDNENDQRGEDVTEKFPESTEKAVNVRKDGKEYLVYDNDTGDLLNDDESLTSIPKVQAFIDELELEDEE